MRHTHPNAPLLLDLYCGAGGAAMGYHYAGFNVIGVDYLFQRYYPFEFKLFKSIEFLLSPQFKSHNFAAIHASPPCQAYTPLSDTGQNSRSEYKDHIPELRSILQSIGLPYVIENVPGAPLINPIFICGASPLLPTKAKRHRLFESNVPLQGIDCPRLFGQPVHPHTYPNYKNAEYISLGGEHVDKWRVERAFGIDWMPLRALKQAIPPAYTEFIGKQLLSHIS